GHDRLPLPQVLRVVWDRHGMEVDDAIDRLVLLLEPHVVPSRSDVVANVDVAGGLDPREHPLLLCHLFLTQKPPVICRRRLWDTVQWPLSSSATTPGPDGFSWPRNPNPPRVSRTGSGDGHRGRSRRSRRRRRWQPG